MTSYLPCKSDSHEHLKYIEKWRKKRLRKKKIQALIKVFIFMLIMCLLFIFIYNVTVLNIKRKFQQQIHIYNTQISNVIRLNKTLLELININVVKEDEKTVKSKNTISELNYSDRELLAKLLYNEGRGESIECQRAIVSVVINRLNSGYWGDTIKEVVYARNQFEPVSRGLIDRTKPLQTQYDAIDYVLEHGTTIPSWVLYFRASYHFDWSGYTKYKSISNTYFGGYK